VAATVALCRGKVHAMNREGHLVLHGAPFAVGAVGFHDLDHLDVSPLTLPLRLG
jgi:hypothetical protein